jgi:uncharacterized protein
MASADFTRTLHVPADPAACWMVLTDVGRVAGWVSILGAVKELEPLVSYTAVLEDRLGPFRLRADLAVEVTELRQPERITLRARGEDRQVASRIAVDATLRLAPAKTGTTVEVAGRYEVTGRVATLGASTIRPKASKVLDEFFAAAERELR